MAFVMGVSMAFSMNPWDFGEADDDDDDDDDHDDHDEI